MQCPNCSAQTQVRDTKSHDHDTERVRQCVACHHRFTTIESAEAHKHHNHIKLATDRLCDEVYAVEKLNERLRKIIHQLND